MSNVCERWYALRTWHVFILSMAHAAHALADALQVRHRDGASRNSDQLQVFTNGQTQLQPWHQPQVHSVLPNPLSRNKILEAHQLTPHQKDTTNGQHHHQLWPQLQDLLDQLNLLSNWMDGMDQLEVQAMDLMLF